MRELGEAVGISKAAIYYHFRDKEALFGALIGESLGQLESLILAAQAREQDARNQVVQIVNAILALPIEDRAMIRVAMQEMGHMGDDAQQAFLVQYHTRFLARLESVFEDGIAEGQFRPLAPETATWTLLGMMYPYFYSRDQSGMRGRGPASIEEMLRIFFDGVCFQGVG